MPADVPTSADAIDRHLGARLRHLRQQRRLSLHACGEILGISYQQIQKYEIGTNRLSTASLVRLAYSFGIPPASFFDGIDVSPTSNSPDSAGGSVEEEYRFPDLQLTRSITRLSPLNRHLLNELVLAIERSQTRPSDRESPTPSKLGP